MTSDESAMTKFTAGPWHVETDEYGSKSIRAADGKTVNPMRSDADAHMLASAPDMYEALKAMLAAEDALSKAKGGT